MPTFENNEHRQSERLIFEEIRKQGLEPLPTPTFHTIDALLYKWEKRVPDPLFHGCVEIKTRTISYGDYGSYKIGQYKINNCLKFAEARNILFYLIVRCTRDEKLVSIEINRNKLNTFDKDWMRRRKGREQRQAAHDTERSYVIPWEAFNMGVKFNV